MVRVPTPAACRLLAFALLLVPAEALAQSDAGPPATTVIASAETVRAGVAHTGGLIADRLAALGGGPGLTPTPERRVQGLALGHAGRPLVADPEMQKLERDFGLKPLPVKPRFGLWSDGARSRLRLDGAGAGLDGTLWSGVIGLDYALADRLTLGLAGAYESQDFIAEPTPATLHGRGLTAAPYALFKFDRVLSLDASGGYGWLGYDGVGAPADVERWFGAANLNANYAFDPWRLGGSLGALHAGARLDAGDGPVSYGGQTSAVGRVRLGYVFRVLDGLEPYVSAEGRYAALDADARLDSMLGIGASVRLGGASLLFQGTTLDGDDAVRSYAGTLAFRLGL